MGNILEEIELEDEVTEDVKYDYITDRLTKGDVIPHEQLEKCLGIDRTHRRYGLSALKFKGYIESSLAKRELNVVCRVLEAVGLKILTDEEALAYTQLRFEQASKQRIRDFKKMKQINRGNLCELSQNTMDRKVVELGRRVQADKTARKESFDYAPVERTTPSRIKVS